MFKLSRNFTTVGERTYLNLLLRWNASGNLSELSNENTTCPSEFCITQTTPSELHITKDGFNIQWDDGEYSEYISSEIERFSIDISSSQIQAFNSVSNLSGDDLVISSLYPKGWYSKRSFVKWGYWDDISQRLNTYGFCAVDLVPSDNDELSDTLTRVMGLKRVESHYGTKEILRVGNTENAHNKQLGYSSDKIPLHTDLPFYETPPRYQSLHCITPAIDGGGNYIVNARWVFNQIKELYPKSISDNLASNNVEFNRVQEEYSKTYVSPVVTENLVRVSPFTMDYSKMGMRHLRDLNTFMKTCRMNATYIKLERRQMLLYDNWKCLHGRQAIKDFNPRRVMIGTYYD